MNAMMPIFYSSHGNTDVIFRPIVTKECVHEEELMKSDLVRLSWEDTDRYEIPVGAYIVPFTDVLGVDRQPAHFTLYKTYQPERTTRGYRYQPEFQHPKMWLGYVPMVFSTKDAEGNDIEKTEYPYVGLLSTLLTDICKFINKSLSYSESDSGRFVLQTLGVDAEQTISITIKDMDVLSAIAEVAKVVGCEWHLDWESKYFYFGIISLGITPYALSVDQNIGLPSVTRSSDKYYNAYLVHGSARNNTRKTENGNIAVSLPLTLDETDYPGSIIDMRDKDSGGNPVGPLLTKILNIDSVYPTYELYLYDLVERRKYKEGDNNTPSGEVYSWWYTRLGRKMRDTAGNAVFTVVNKDRGTTGQEWMLNIDTYFRVEYFTDATIDGSVPKPTARLTMVYDGSSVSVTASPGSTTQASGRCAVAVTEEIFNATNPGDKVYFSSGFNMERLPYENGGIFKELKLVDKVVTKVGEKTGNAKISFNFPSGDFFNSAGAHGVSQNWVTVIFNDVKYLCGVETPETYSGYLYLVPFIYESTQSVKFADLYAALETGDVLELKDLKTTENLPYTNLYTYAVDGLAPTLAMQMNTSPGSLASLLGTREFEVNYHDSSILFDDGDFDVDNGSTTSVVTTDSNGGCRRVAYKGYTLPAGYYEIIHKEEGSDKLVIPDTSITAGNIIPQAYAYADEDNNRCTIYNIALDDEAKAIAQRKLKEAAEKAIAEEMLDTNNYTFKSNSVAFEGRNPNLYIGRRVNFNGDGINLITRILKLSTKLDYSFEQEITVGNKVIKSKSDRLSDELWALQNDFDNWTTAVASSIGGSGLEHVIVEYDHWDADTLYYYETLSRTTGKIEISRVWHYDALWECRRSFTSEEPTLGCSDWVLLRMPTISLPFFDGDGLPLMVLPVHSEGVIEETVVPKLMFGQYDFSEAVTAWQWERESDYPDLDAIWNAQARARRQELTLVNADFPSAWWTGTLSWKCTAWFEGVGQEAVELTNVITA